MYIEKPFSVAPCEEACPAGIDIPRYVRAISQRNFDEALAIDREKIPFPSVCAYVCTAPCEKECRMNVFGKPIAIKALKRLAIERGCVYITSHDIKPSGKKVAIIGSGPAGLTAAYFLTRKGHIITVYEASREPGGSMRREISAGRLPVHFMEQEIKAIKDAGVDIKTGVRIRSLDILFEKGYAAVFLAIGTGSSVDSPFAAEDSPIRNLATIISPLKPRNTPSVSDIYDIPSEVFDKFGRIIINPYNMSTTVKGIFAGGDMISESSSIIEAIADGKKGAISIDKYLGGNGDILENLVTKREKVNFSIPDLSLQRADISAPIIKEHANGTDVVNEVLEEKDVINECKRCLRCDIPVYIDELKCIGCGTCETVCSGDVIRISEETNKATIQYPQDCWTCYNCELACETGAITVSPIEKQRPTAWETGRQTES